MFFLSNGLQHKAPLEVQYLIQRCAATPEAQGPRRKEH
jgi:hypothetical protein